MITIRSTSDVSGPTLIGLEATLNTPTAAYEFSSPGPMLDARFPSGGNLFGAISWPQARFRIQPDLTIEQQMFISHNSSDIAISWELKGKPIPMRLVVRPHFGGCSQRRFRDVGFQFDPNEEGGRLVWLPSVCGPKIIADTNGSYFDEPLRSACDIAGSSKESETRSVVVPGRFEFELGDRPSILVLSQEGRTSTEGQQLTGRFLANLIRPLPRREASTVAKSLVVA